VVGEGDGAVDVPKAEAVPNPHGVVAVVTVDLCPQLVLAVEDRFVGLLAFHVVELQVYETGFIPVVPEALGATLDGVELVFLRLQEVVGPDDEGQHLLLRSLVEPDTAVLLVLPVCYKGEGEGHPRGAVPHCRAAGGRAVAVAVHHPFELGHVEVDLNDHEAGLAGRFHPWGEGCFHVNIGQQQQEWRC